VPLLELEDEDAEPELDVELDATLGAPPLPAAPPPALELELAGPASDVAPPDPEEVEVAPPVLLADEPFSAPQPPLATMTDPTTIACPRHQK
jgi:hypothetical protein